MRVFQDERLLGVEYRARDVTDEAIETACTLANFYLPPEAGGHGNDRRGLVEKPWTEAGLREWLRSGARLYTFTEKKSGELAGVLVGCAPGERMKEEAGSTKLAIDAHNGMNGLAESEKGTDAEAFWIYYLIAPRNNRLLGMKASGLFIKFMQEDGMRFLVADAMIPTEECPHACLAGLKIMKHLGFEETTATYDNRMEEEYQRGAVPLQRFVLLVKDLRRSSAGGFGDKTYRRRRER